MGILNKYKYMVGGSECIGVCVCVLSVCVCCLCARMRMYVCMCVCVQVFVCVCVSVVCHHAYVRMHVCVHECACVRACDLPGHVVNDRGEMCGSIESNRLEALVVSLHHPLYPTAVRILGVPILHRHTKNKQYRNQLIDYQFITFI
jgi:hypothetical protein